MMRVQAEIGASPDGGLSRPSLSLPDLEVREWFRQAVEAQGLRYQIDGAGNQSGILHCTDPQAPTLLIGSHLDSVPNGGRYDGALGVIAALETAFTLKEAGTYLPFHLEVINFTDEEGTLVGLLGSSALTGSITRDALLQPRGGRHALESGMARLGLSPNSIIDAHRDPARLSGYIEVHIEQGTRLEQSQTDIGVVTSVVGIRSMWLVFTGEAAHAGTSPMDGRRDAFRGAAQFALDARDRVVQDFHPGVVNFGDIEIAPGAFNIVPSEVRLGVEFRHGDQTELETMEDALLSLANQIATTLDLELQVIRMHDLQPAPMAPQAIRAVEAACKTLGLKHQPLLSFAGHDAQSMAKVTPSALYFVPSVDGISHNAKEYTRDQDCINAANVMLHTVLQWRDL
ncbi:MAG: M20 family metallo-hydrolase [Anaerolineae bacterium]